MSSSLDRNWEYASTAYKQIVSPLEIGSWLAKLATFLYDDNGIQIKYPEELISGNYDLPSPIIIRVDQKTFYEDVRILINYDIALFSHYVDDTPIYTRYPNQTTELLIPKNTKEETLINPSVSGVVKINSVEILEGLNKPLEFTILALASTNTKFFNLFKFDDQIDLGYRLFFSRFINKLPCWMCNGEGTYEDGTCPNCNGSGEDQSFFTDKIADNIALDLNVFRQTFTESDETLRQRCWGQRRWVIPRSLRNLDSNIHSVCARYLDLNEEDIFIYEKLPNFYSVDPEASWRARVKGWDFFDDWTHNGTEASGSYLAYEEIIKNKNFEDRLLISSHRGYNNNWINCFTSDGKHNNTVRISDYGYSYEVIGQQGYSGFYQSVDFTEMNSIQIAYQFQSNPYLPHVPPGAVRGRYWILISDTAMQAFNTNEAADGSFPDYEALITGATILQQGIMYYGDYPTPGTNTVTLDVSGTNGTHFLYFIVHSEWDEVYFTVEIILNTYGEATAMSPVFDNEQRADTIQIYPYPTLVDPAATMEWRYRVAVNIGDLYTATWSTWRPHTAVDFPEDDIRYLQFQIRLNSNSLQATSPIIVDEFDFLIQHIEYVSIILDPTVAISMPINQRGSNYWWSYESGDQTRFKELVDSMVTGCVTPRTEFYYDWDEEL